MLQPADHLVLHEWTKAKSGAARLDGRDDLGEVVADETEPSVLGVLLNN